ncbi:hypothetical protein QBC37DRAFT_413413 [Rhypophila decipiens]|uniref:Aminoglycoside phosphotransferase domain-containing protein n=1 Tax=Rhypophila decipiens TaxID=261697 RepID=A0AAN7BBY5_9PEZI|nr:hypothetical protein QBC37DRAFT_413413 [Rhypophila decipiens]
MFRQQTPNGTGNKDTSDFFSRLGLPTIEVRKLCWDLIKTHYSNEDIKINDHDIREAPNQGFCSYTLFLDPRPDTIVQFRSLTHKLDLDIINAAREIYGELVAVTELIRCLDSSPTSTNSPQNHDLGHHGKRTPDPSLLVYSQSRIQGMSLAEFYNTPQCQYHDRESLVKSFAGIISRGLLASPHHPRHSHAVPKGRVGSTIRHRLEMMQRELPIRFRPTVDKTLEALPKIEALPWVLTHGDLVPSNVIIDFCSSKQQHRYSSCNNCSSSSQQPTNKNNDDPLPFIRGLIDWAEAEYLPFGVGIYGLEEFLGVQLPIIIPVVNETDDPTTTPPPPKTASKLDTNGKKYPPPASKFTYFSEAETLRSLFWTELEARIRGAEINSKAFLHTTTTDDNLLETVRLARTLGILLWHGIAFDDGRLDRVVCEGIDDEEIQRLDIHLGLHERGDRLKN